MILEILFMINIEEIKDSNNKVKFFSIAERNRLLINKL